MTQKLTMAGMVMVLVALCCAALFGQATATSTLQGTIFDKQQAVMVGVSVVLTNKATGLTRTATSNESGTYRFEFLPAGFYQIGMSASGFSTATADNIELLVGQTSTMDVTLSPGTLTEVITVTTEAPLVDLQKTSVGLNLTPADIQDYPLNGRDFANLAILAPGVKPVASYDPTKNRLAIFSVNGGQGRNVNMTVNGVDNKDNTVGGPVMQLPLEAVQESVINTQRFSAANGRSEGAAVNVVTKSGSNGFHGSAYLLERNERLNTKNFFEDPKAEKTPFSRQQFGGSIGGPIRKDKDFFFFALERQREITNIIVTPDAQTQLNLAKPLGAQPGPSIAAPYRDWRYSARVDHSFNANHNLYVTYNEQKNRGLNDQANQNSDQTVVNFTTNRLQLINATLNSILGPRVVNTFTAGYQYWNNLIDTDTKLPRFIFVGLYNFGTNGNVPQESYQAKWQFRDDISMIRGSHGFKFGFDYVWEPKLGGFFAFNSTLTFNWLDKPSEILSNKAKYPDGFRSRGAIKGISIANGNPYFDLPGGAKMFGVYFQDDWKVRRNFTLNLGVRWDKDFNLIGTDVQPRSRTYLALKAIGSPFAASLPEDDNRGVSPRIGFAWDMTGSGKHTLRGGYGLYFGQTFLNIPLFMVQQANDLLYTSVISISSSGPRDANAEIVPGTAIKLSDYRFGIDPLPTIPTPAAKLQSRSVGRLVDPSYRNPYTQQWNVGYAWQLTHLSAIEVEYVHVLGLHESKTIDINPTRIARGAGRRQLDTAFDSALLPKLARIDVAEAIGRSRYDGLNLSYRQRMTHHFTLNTSYVLSRAVAYQGHAAAFGNRPTNPDDPFSPIDFGPAPNDERHRWVLGGVVELPWGLQVTPILQLSSGRTYNATQGLDVFGLGTGAGDAHAILLKSDPRNLTATKSKTATQLRDCIKAGDCFEATFDLLRGQAFFQLDTRVSKKIRFGERASLKLIFQAFDLTNRANFGNQFVGNIQNSSFGQPSGFITGAGVIVPRSFSGEFGAQLNF